MTLQHPMQKLPQNGLDLNMKAKLLKFKIKKIIKSLYDLRQQLPRYNTKRIIHKEKNKLSVIKFKIFCSLKHHKESV